MKMTKYFLTFYFAIITLSSAFASAGVQGQDVLRAARENQARLLNALKELKNEKAEQLQFDIQSLSATSRRHCEEEDDKPERETCVPNCSVRGSSGTCLSYGRDFCGPNATCVENCSVRGSSGRCLSYSSDYCGDNVSCSEVCEVRGSSGTCLSYGSDQCY